MINWEKKIDLTRPLIALDEHAFLFPGASKEQRLVISQMMGLIIARCVTEMEECLVRLRPLCWEKLKRKFPVSPEFNELGDQFFVCGTCASTPNPNSSSGQLLLHISVIYIFIY